MKAFLVVSLLLGPAAGPADSTPPGGYWRFGEKRDPEPNDGHDNLMIGGIMASLGVLRTAAGVVHVYIAQPVRCADVERYGIDPESCPQLRGYGWGGIAFGGAFLLTGVAMLAIGGVQRKRHRAWKDRYGIAVVPRLGRDRFGGSLVLRF